MTGKDMPILSRQSFGSRSELVKNLPTEKTIYRPNRGRVYIVLQA
jgi:hypothetical protein